MKIIWILVSTVNALVKIAGNKILLQEVRKIDIYCLLYCHIICIDKIIEPGREDTQKNKCFF